MKNKDRFEKFEQIQLMVISIILFILSCAWGKMEHWFYFGTTLAVSIAMFILFFINHTFYILNKKIDELIELQKKE